MKALLIIWAFISLIAVVYTIWEVRLQKYEDDGFIRKYKSFNEETADHFRKIYQNIKR